MRIRTKPLAARATIKTITYDIQSTPLGTLNVAITEFGVCKININQPKASFLIQLKSDFPNALITRETLSDLIKNPTTLDLYGTDFQFKVWQQLLKIPHGQTTTYATIATAIDNPKATRAVGTAIGKNPIAIIIPCHRVLRSDGGIGGYAWGIDVKQQLIKAER